MNRKTRQAMSKLRAQARQLLHERLLAELDEDLKLAKHIDGECTKRPIKCRLRGGVGGYHPGYTTGCRIASTSNNYGARDMRDRITEAREALL